MSDSSRREELSRYLELLGAEAPEHCLVDLRCKPAGRETVRQSFWPLGSAGLPTTILRRAPSHDVYIGVAPRLYRYGGREALGPGALVWADCDSDKAVSALQRLPEPTMLVASGSGSHRHAYWLLERRLAPGELAAANRRIARALGADRGAVTSAAALLRPPGTVNHKRQPPAAVRLLACEPSRRYAIGELLAGAPERRSFAPRHLPTARLAGETRCSRSAPASTFPCSPERPSPATARFAARCTRTRRLRFTPGRTPLAGGTASAAPAAVRSTTSRARCGESSLGEKAFASSAGGCGGSWLTANARPDVASGPPTVTVESPPPSRGWRILLRYRDGSDLRLVLSRRSGPYLEVVDRGERELDLVECIRVSDLHLSQIACSAGHRRASAARRSHAGRAQSAASRPALGPRAKEQTMPTLTATAPREATSTKAHERLLGRYRDPDGALRTIVAIPGAQESTLIVDRVGGADTDTRLVAHLDAEDEAHTLDRSRDTAYLIAELYLRDPSRGWCRPLHGADLDAVPEDAPAAQIRRTLTGSDGVTYGLRIVTAGAQRELRWVAAAPTAQPRAVSVRAVIAALECYEPVRAITIAALARYADCDVQCRRLHDELRRVDRGRCVLNRRLREAVVRTVERGELTYSEIARRCERNHGGADNCGDTSWLKRRIGLLPDLDAERPTPWLRAETLALIAREGLGVDPVSVEV